MFEIPYYHELIKKATIGFGALFSQVKVIRRNPNAVDPKEAVQIVNVPIAYGPKEKFLTRIDQDPELNGHVYITLPRMAFEIVSYSYDTSRMTNRNNKIQCKDENGLTAVYTPVPYNLDFQLSILTKGTEDSLAIIEQILPLFTPEYSMTINAIPELNITQDIPIILNGVSVTDDFEGDFALRRLVTHVLSFTLKVNLFGPITSNGVILQTNTDLPGFEQHVATMDEDGNIIVDRWDTVDNLTNNLRANANVGTGASGDVDVQP